VTSRLNIQLGLAAIEQLVPDFSNQNPMTSTGSCDKKA